MSDPIDDTAFDEYLKGGSLVSQRYREIGGDEVPPELDRRILQQAHAVASRRPARSRVWMRWSAPLALAASAVLVVSIVMNSGVQQKTVVLSTPQAAPDAAVEAEHGNEVPQAPRGDERRELTYDVPAAPPAPAPMLVPPPKVAGPVERAPAAVARSRQAPRGDVEAKRAEANSAQTGAAEGSAAKAAAAETSEITVTGNRLRDVSPPLPVHVDIPIDAPSQAITQTTAARKQSGTAASHSVHLDPQRWLEDIRQLRKDGKSTEADREWERFRAAFPHYAVADDDVARKRESEQ